MRQLSLLLVVALALACANETPTGVDAQRTPTGPAASEASSPDEAGQVTEDLTVSLSFEDPGKSQLAPSTTIGGKVFVLHLEQSFDQTTRVLSLEMSLENAYTKDLWRPLRVETTGLTPSDANFVSSDNDEDHAGAIWDYGQTTGSDGKIAVGATSLARTIEIQMPGQNEASLQSLSVTFRVSAQVDPQFMPSTDRVVSPEEAESGFMAGMILIDYAAGLQTPSQLATANLTYGLIGQDFYEDLDAYVAFSEDPDFDATQKLALEIQDDPEVEFADISYVHYDFGYPDPVKEIASHHGIGLGNFTSAWQEEEEGQGRLPGSGVTVGLIDSGLDSDGVEFDENGGRTVEVLGESGTDDDLGHGTKVGGLIGAASNGTLVVGGAYGANLVSIKARDAASNEAYWEGRVVTALKIALDREDIDIVNLSNGYYPRSSDVGSITRWEAHAERTYGRVIQAIEARGTLIVAATGNCDINLVAYPARFDEVVAVGGTDAAGEERHRTTSVNETGQCPNDKAYNNGSSYEENVTEFVAPSVGINALLPDNAETNAFGGTSAAAPQVAAMAAIIQAQTGLTGAELRTELQKHVEYIGQPGIDRNAETGYGRIQYRSGSASTAFIPEGSQIVFQHNPPEKFPDLFAVTPDLEPIPITDNSLKEEDPSLARDGERIAFVRNGDIYSINVDGSNLQLLRSDEAFLREPDWSPDGDRLVYVKNRDLHIYDLITSEERRLTFTPDPTGFESAQERNPVWSPDGDQIAFDCNCIPSSGDIYRDIWVINDDGSGLRNLTDDPALDEGPNWSPDGSRLAYEHDDEPHGGGVRRIYTVHTSGADKQPFTDPPSGLVDLHPSWSPDGSRLVFVRGLFPDLDMIVSDDQGNLLGNLSEALAFPDDQGDLHPAWGPQP